MPFQFSLQPSYTHHHVILLQLRRVRGEQLGHGPPVRKMARIPDAQLVGIDAYLDGCADRVVAVDQGVEQDLAERVLGQPLHETDFRAAWVLWDPVERVVEFRKTEYDRLQAAQDIVNAGLPLESAGRLLNT